MVCFSAPHSQTVEGAIPHLCKQAKPTGKRIRWSEYISDLAWSRLSVEPAQLSEISVDCEVF